MCRELQLASHGRQLNRVIAVADLSAVARSAKADVAQLAERVLGKDEVTGSIPVIGSSLRSLRELRLGKPYSRASAGNSQSRASAEHAFTRELRFGRYQGSKG
jgi:hypothetical protein